MKDGIKLLAVVVGLAVVLVGAGLALRTVVGGGGCDREWQDVPEDAVAAAGVRAPWEIVTKLRQALPPDVLDRARAGLPFDVFSEEAWNRYGFDPTAGIGFAWLDPEAEAGMVSMGSTGEPDVRERVLELLKLLGGHIDEERAELAGLEAILLDEREAAILFKGDRIVLVAGDHLRRLPGADGARNGLRLLAERIAKLEAGRCTAVPTALQPAVAALGDSAIRGYVSFDSVRQRIGGDDSEAAMARKLLGEAAGVAAGVSARENRVAFRYRLPLSESSRWAAIYDVPRRDPEVFERIPGPALAGFHSRFDLDALRAVFESYLQLDPYAAEEYRDMSEDLRRELQIDLNADILGALNGEVGMVVDELPPRANPFAFHLVAFAGLRDVPRAEALLDRLYRLAQDVPGVSVEKSTSGENTVYTLSAVGILTGPAVAVHDGRLWLALRSERLREIIAGEAGSMMTEGRASDVAQILERSYPSVGFVDLRALLAQVPGLLSKRERRELAAFAPMTAALDRGAAWSGADDGILGADEVIYFREGEDLWSLVGRAAGLAAAMEGPRFR